MCNKITYLMATAAVWLATACTQRDKCVENPLIEASNTMTLDISKVELSDTATKTPFLGLIKKAAALPLKSRRKKPFGVLLKIRSR